jgi:hypothetical protein
MSTNASLAVANIISEQIGPRAFLMMGTRHKLADGPALLFDIRGSRRFNKVKVSLTPDDTYTVEFWKVRSHSILSHLVRENVYADSLNQCIEHNTGLALSL